MYERLSQLYNLSPFEQDWGICNADSARVGEFIRFFLSHEAVDPWEWEELADLVFESANDAIREGLLTDEQEMQIVSIVTEHKDKFPNQLEYWLAFGNESEYPVKKLIQRGYW